MSAALNIQHIRPDVASQRASPKDRGQLVQHGHSLRHGNNYRCSLGDVAWVTLLSSTNVQLTSNFFTPAYHCCM